MPDHAPTYTVIDHWWLVAVVRPPALEVDVPPQAGLDALDMQRVDRRPPLVLLPRAITPRLS
jgi:hypothetical protein